MMLFGQQPVFPADLVDQFVQPILGSVALVQGAERLCGPCATPVVEDHDAELPQDGGLQVDHIAEESSRFTCLCHGQNATTARSGRHRAKSIPGALRPPMRSASCAHVDFRRKPLLGSIPAHGEISQICALNSRAAAGNWRHGAKNTATARNPVTPDPCWRDESNKTGLRMVYAPLAASNWPDGKEAKPQASQPEALCRWSGSMEMDFAARPFRPAHHMGARSNISGGVNNVA